MRLLVATINQPEKLDDVLAGFLEIGVTGATVLQSEGMGRVLSHDIPFFAGLHALASRSRPQNQTILSVMEDDQVDPALALIEEICGNLDTPATGIAYTVPLDRVVGLAGRLEDSGS